MKSKKLNPLLQNKKYLNTLLFFLLISNLFAVGGFLWSIRTIPLQSTTIQLPDTFRIGDDQESYQFPLKREMAVSFPEMIRYGDVQEITLSIVPKIDPTKCEDFCLEKHLTYENVWAFYKVNMILSYDLNNLILDPMGETILPLAKSSVQDFHWKVKALQYNPAYLKSTIFMQFIATNGEKEEDQLVFARELTIPVRKVGPFSFPVFRIICVVWFVSTLMWLLLNHRIFMQANSSKMM